jgi:hypothetical protein
MRGFSTLVGGYPSEAYMIQQWIEDSQGRSQEIAPLPWTFWLYLFLFCGGIFISQKFQRELAPNGETTWIFKCFQKCKCCACFWNLKDLYKESADHQEMEKVCNFKSHYTLSEVDNWAKVKNEGVGKLISEIETLFTKTVKVLSDSKTAIEENEDTFNSKIDDVKKKYHMH